MMDHIANQEDTTIGGSPDMKHLSKPRGKGYAFRMVTPDALIGEINPLTGRSFGREIKLGLGTRRHAEAVRLRDVHLGQIRQLEADALRKKGLRGAGRIIDLSPENVLAWIETRQSMKNTDAIDHVLLDELDKAAQSGHGDAAQSFAAVVFKGAVSLDNALELYLDERSEGNPFGFDPLAITTALNVQSTVKHLREFLGGEAPTLNDVTPTKAFTFRTQHPSFAGEGIVFLHAQRLATPTTTVKDLQPMSRRGLSGRNVVATLASTQNSAAKHIMLVYRLTSDIRSEPKLTDAEPRTL